MIPETKAPLSLKRTLYFDILELVDLLSVPVLLFVVSQVTLYTVQQSHNRRCYHQTGNDFGNKGKENIHVNQIGERFPDGDQFRMSASGTPHSQSPRGSRKLHKPSSPTISPRTRFDLYLKQQLSPRLT